MKPTHHITAYRRANQVREMIVLLVTCLAALLCPTVHSADASVEWCYHKPACNFTTWSKIAPQYCNGSKQSPINIVTASVQGNPNLTSFNLTGFDDNSTFMSIGNSGDSVVVNLDDEKIKVQGGALPGVYNTKQFHLHWGNGSSSPGSEHTVDGKQYPMELHIVSVHSKYNGSVSAALAAKDSTALAVLGFFIEGTNEANKTKSWDILTSYLTKIRNSGDQTSDIMNQITLNSLIEGVDRTKYYRYQGSLTTPSCNEAVIWTVFKEPVKVSQAFINRFSTTVFFKDASASVLNTNNFRGVQPLNGRVVTSQVTVASAAPSSSTLSVITILLLSSLCWL
ncbi:carbonic anhydrase 7-like isoform X2 [Onychostoma macrolepis]|uniref:carbonic anhydrase 7-like isoform X2 n=1 Tax=Onychostoma macrolepis TaxID=369639 RepID=UPI00272DAA6D|nr:carbonic anhydrase 7-like isoform X2 [Onychostoma macrolepis]